MNIRFTKKGSFSSHDTRLWDQPIIADAGDEVEIEDVWGARIIELGFAEEIDGREEPESPVLRDPETLRVIEVREPETVEEPPAPVVEAPKLDPATKRADRKAARKERKPRKAGQTVEVK